MYYKKLFDLKFYYLIIKMKSFLVPFFLLFLTTVNSVNIISNNSTELNSESECQVVNYLKKAGFPSNTWGTMTCISKYESSWNCKANNKNTDGSTDYGLFEINSYYWCSGDPTSKYNECNVPCTSLYDCQKNTDCAYKVYREQGYNAWYGYQYHKSECDNYVVNC